MAKRLALRVEQRLVLSDIDDTVSPVAPHSNGVPIVLALQVPLIVLHEEKQSIASPQTNTAVTLDVQKDMPIVICNTSQVQTPPPVFILQVSPPVVATLRSPTPHPETFAEYNKRRQRRTEQENLKLSGTHRCPNGSFRQLSSEQQMSGNTEMQSGPLGRSRGLDQQRKTQQSGPLICFYCQKQGHVIRKCRFKMRDDNRETPQAPVHFPRFFHERRH